MKPAPRSPAHTPQRKRFWGVFVLPLLVLGLALDGLTAWASIEGSAPTLAAAALLAGWALLLAVAAVGGAVAWRTAGHEPATAAAWALRSAVVLGSGAVFIGAALHFAPQAGHWLRLARGDDPLGSVQAELSPDGRRLRLHGPLASGAATLVARALAAAPQAWLLELDSPGGRFHEARAIADLVRGRGLQTRAVGPCDRACVLVFMAGRGRQLMPSARLGLNRADSGAVLPLFDLLARRWQAADYRPAGLSEALLDKAMRASPRSVWAPQSDELLAAGVIGVPGQPFDVTLPPREGVGPGDHADALVSHPAWRVLDQRRPGTIAAAAARMRQAHAADVPDDAVQVAAQSVVEALLPELLREAGEPLREQYVTLWSEQLLAARAAGAAACRGVLVGDTAARRSLPQSLVLREAGWLTEAAAEPPLSLPPRRPTALELEVVQRTLGERAPEMLAGVRRPPPGAGCERATALVEEVLRMPAPERRLAIRLMF